MGDDETCKVADSGLLLEVPKGDSINMKRADVSYRVRWMPPESISQHKFSSASDVWSFGILLWEMFNPGIIPYKRLDDVQVTKFVRSIVTAIALDLESAKLSPRDLRLRLWHPECSKGAIVLLRV